MTAEMLDAGLDAAVVRALAGRARLTTTVRTSMPMALPPEFADKFPAETVLTGHVDFIADRCSLVQEGVESRMAGAASYMLLEDGRWQVSEGPEGSWALWHPHGLLAGLQHARTSVVSTDGLAYVVSLDVSELGKLINPGIAASWQPRAEVVLSDQGALTSASLVLIDGDARSETQFDFEWIEDPIQIDLPPADLIISIGGHLEEMYGGHEQE